MLLPIVIGILLLIGVTFNALGVIGILRFPDVYTRLHADTKATTYGSIFTALAVIVYSLAHFRSTTDPQYATLAVHAVIAVVVLALTNATGAHAIARAAHRSGVKPARAVVDRMEEGGS